MIYWSHGLAVQDCNALHIDRCIYALILLSSSGLVSITSPYLARYRQLAFRHEGRMPR